MAAEKLRTEQRREQIAAAALDIVSKRGLRGLSMGAVARRVGLVPSAIYRHFRNKDQVIDAILGLIEQRLHENIAVARDHADAPLEVLHRMLRGHIRYIRDNAGVPRVVFSEEVYGGHNHRKERINGIIQGYLREVATLFEAAQRDGDVRPDIAPDQLAVMFLGLIQPAAILWHVSDGRFDVTRQAEKAWTAFLFGIKAPPG